MKIEHITYKGREIIVVNWFECKTPDEMLELLNKEVIEYANSVETLLILDDFTDTFLTKEFMQVAKEKGKNVFAKLKTKKNAIVGMTGVKKILLEAYNKVTKDKIVPFDTKQEALEYLVSE